VPTCDHEPVSLYVPARNAEATLAACLQAVRAQTQPPGEFFILADPRSSDRTLHIARDSGVRVIAQTGPTLGAARNQAVLAAGCRWVACCDADVLIAPDWLEKLAARRGTGAVGIGGRTLERTRGPADEWRALHLPHHWGEHAFKNPFMLVSEVLFDRTALLAIGGYRDDLNYYEDSDLCQRLREGGYDLLYEPAAVAVHQRRDDLLSLLTLRWKYSEYRQKHLLDRYVGLLEKCRVNREYALNTLSRSLARGREELTYLSYLLFFHHLVLDLRALLSRRPLFDEAGRQFCEQALAGRALEAAAGCAHGLTDWLRADLAALCPAPLSQEHEPDLPPTWPAHLDAVQTAVERFCGEFSGELAGIIVASARYCHQQAGAEEVPRLARPAPAALHAALAGLPLRPGVDVTTAKAIRTVWPDASGIHLVGPALESERAALGVERDAAGVVAVAAHLEALAEPLRVFHEGDAHWRRLVACYQPPDRFIPGLDALTAADLASAAAGAGWHIERFDTLVGRTRLMLSR